MPHISSSEDLYGPVCVRVPARVLPHTLSGAALASLLAPSSVLPLLVVDNSINLCKHPSG
jgi:hypothetical protein